MNKFIVVLFFSCLGLLGSAQNNPPLPKDAKIDGTIVHMVSKLPQNNELIIFKSQKNGNEYQAISDSLGKFFTRLPIGDKYEIFIMGFKDSTSYNVIDIPALGPNAYYHKPQTACSFAGQLQ